MVKVYKRADGKWVVVFGPGDRRKQIADTEQEAREMANKITFVEKLQAAATLLAQVADAFADLESVYFDRGFNSGGANAIADADIAGTGLTAAQVGSGITLAQQVSKFVNNQAVTTGDYDATINTLRTDV